MHSGALVVDATPCDASVMSEGLLATLIQEDDTEFEEPAARCESGRPAATGHNDGVEALRGG